MMLWQVLRARQATEAGYRAHHGPGVWLHYSTADAADAAEAPDGSRSFCLSREKLSLQQLNTRLDSYLQQVHHLEATNQRLERQIQEELDRKCPRELRKLDGHLRTSSLLQDKISDCLSAQAQVKLQLLSAELTAGDLAVRCEKERERRGRLEVELRKLRLLEDELLVHRLPELQSLLDHRTQQVTQLQLQHQQDVQVLLAGDSRGPVVEMHSAESPDLNQQLDDLRRTNVTLFDKNQECWFNSQVSTLSSPEVTANPAEGSQAVRAELEELKRTAASLEEELTGLQTVNMVLEASGLQQNESSVQQLVVLQQEADGLCRDLDFLLQEAAQRAADHQALLDVKSRLETEIREYRRLLDGLSRQGVSRPHSSSAARFTAFCATSSPSAFRRNIAAKQPASVQEGNLRMMEVQQGFTTTGSDTQPARTAAVQAEPETFTSNQTTADVGVQGNKTGTNIQTEIPKTVPCAEPEVKQGAHFVTYTTSADPKQTAAEETKETETVIAAQMNCIENQDPVQVVSLSLETPEEAAVDAEEVVVAASVESGSHIFRPEEAQGKDSGEMASTDEKDKEKQGKKCEEEVEEATLTVFRLDQSSALSKLSNRKQNKVVEDAEKASGSETASSSYPDSNNYLESKTDSTEIIKTTDLEVNNREVVNDSHDTLKTKVNPAQSDNEMVNLEGPESLLSTTESDKSSDPGVALSSSGPEEILSPREACVFVHKQTNPGPCLSPERSASPAETQECVKSPESPPRPNGEEEEEEVCLSLTEANAHVRPVEKHSLTTKEEGQSLSLSRDQARSGPEEDNKKENGLQLGSGLGGLEIGGPDGCCIIADKEENLGFGGMYWKSVRDARSPGDGCRSTGGIADNKDVVQPGGSPEGRCGLDAQKRTSSYSESRGQKNSDVLVANMPDMSDRVLVKSANFGSDPANVGTSFRGVTCYSGGAASSNMPASCFGGTAADALDVVSGNAEAATAAEVQERFRHDRGEWTGYGGSLGHRSTSLNLTGKKEGLSEAMLPAKSQPDTEKLSGRGSGEWMVYSLGRRRSLDGSNSVASEGKAEGPSVAPNSATGSRETRFGRRGSGEWLVYGGSLERKSRLSNTRREKSPTAAMSSATSQPELRGSGSAGSGEWRVYNGSLKRTSSDSLTDTDSRESLQMARGSGEWRVFGGSTGSMSSWAGSNSFLSVDDEEIPSEAARPATSQPGAAERFASGGSGEWRVGGSTGRLSSAGSEDRISVSTNYSQMISSPSSHTSSRPRLGSVGSVGSGGRLGSGRVVRRSSSLGSGGRLNSSASGSRLSDASRSHRASSSGRFGSAGSGELKPVYSSASGRRSSVGSAGSAGGGGATSSQRAPSPGGRISVSMGSGGWLSASSPGSGSKLSRAGSNERISSSAGSGRTNSTGGRVISSSRPIRSTGSGAGGNKERISVCKMAALSISAAVRKRNQEKQRQTQCSRQQDADTSPLVQRWLTTGVGVTSADPGGPDDIMRL